MAPPERRCTLAAVLFLALSALSAAAPRASPAPPGVKSGLAAELAAAEAIVEALMTSIEGLWDSKGQGPLPVRVAGQPTADGTGIGGIGEPASSWLEPWARAIFFKAVQDAPALASWFAATIFNENPILPGTDPRDWERIRPRVFELLVRGDLWNPVGLPLALQRLEEALRADVEEAREKAGAEDKEEGGDAVLPLRGPLLGLRPLVNV